MDNGSNFKNWFDAIWLGDEDSGQFIPNQKDEDYAEYLEQYTLAHGAYKYALSHSKERIAELDKDAERFVVRRKYADMVCYAYAHHNGFFDWGVLSQAVKLDTKLQAVALISSMRLANDESVTVENMHEAMKGSNDDK